MPTASTSLPIGVIGIAVGTVLVPEMTHRLAVRRRARARARRRIGPSNLRCCWRIPCVVAFLVVPGLIMRALFMRGAFTAADAHAAAMTLMAYTIGLVPFVLIRSVVAPFLARGDTATPVKAALIGTAINIAFKVVLMVPLAQVGLALATSIGAWINFILVLFFAARGSCHRLGCRAQGLAGQARRRRHCARARLVDRRPARHGAVIVVVQVPQRIGAGAVGAARRRGLWGAGCGVVWTALALTDAAEREARRSAARIACRHRRCRPPARTRSKAEGLRCA